MSLNLCKNNDQKKFVQYIAVRQVPRASSEIFRNLAKVNALKTAPYSLQELTQCNASVYVHVQI